MAEHREYTSKDSEEILKQLQKIFTVARILKDDEVAGEHEHEGARCYEFWGKKEPCENCSSYKTLSDKQDRLKYEYIDGKPYQVLSEYVSVDGRPGVMEMLKEIESVTISPEDAKTLATRIFNINSELYQDALTGVSNRKYFEDYKDTKLLNAGVAFIDVDNFKSVNDTLGHEAGDEVLRLLGNILSKNTRESDTVIRYGGDEFLLVFPNIPTNTFQDRLESIAKQFKEARMFDEVDFSLSIGGIICKQISLQDASKKADAIMYEAKKVKDKVIVKEDVNES